MEKTVLCVYMYNCVCVCVLSIHKLMGIWFISYFSFSEKCHNKLGCAALSFIS